MVSSIIIKKTRNRWYLATNDLYDGAEPFINWQAFLPPNEGTKHQRSYLLESSKELVIALISAPRDKKGEILAHGTVLNWVWMIRRLVRWMISDGIWRFSALDALDLVLYIKNCSQREDGRGLVSSFTLNQRLRILQQMWDLRERYASALRINPATLAIDPTIQPQRRSSWRALDESVALPLIRDAITWLTSHSEYMISVFQRMWSENAIGRSRGMRRVWKTKRYVEIEREAGLQNLRKDLNQYDNTTYSVLAEANRITTGACITLLLFLIGMRIRELIRLNFDCLKSKVSINGEEMFHLYGIAAKKGGLPRTWISCEPVNAAVKYLEQCCSDARRYSRQKSLLISYRSGVFPTPGRRMNRMVPSAVRERMLAFARSSFRIGAPAIQRLHPHVARKTFARFVVLRDKRALESVAYHFGHVHRSITDSHYVGSDIELAQLIEEEGRRDLAQGLTDLLSAPFVGGKAGAVLLKLKVENNGKFRGKKAVSTLVERLINNGVQLAPCDWGYCVYSQALSACGGDSNGPNESRRSPDICSSCSNFAVTEKHRHWWEQRHSRDDDFLKQQNLPEQTVRWVERRRANTADILVALNNKIAIK